jgi:tetratricopeptide (TPR) repeat protein
MQLLNLPKDHPMIAASVYNLANWHQSRREYGKAVSLHEFALAMMRRSLPEDHPDIATCLNNLALCHSGQREYDKAVSRHEEALVLRKRRALPEEDHPDIASSVYNLANCHQGQGEYGKAVFLHEKSLAMRRRLLEEDHPDIASSVRELAKCYFSQGEHGKAKLLHEETLARQRRLLGEDHPSTARSMYNLATFHIVEGQYGRAVLLYEEALAVHRRRGLPEDHPDIAWCTAGVGLALTDLGDHSNAVLHLKPALDILTKSIPLHRLWPLWATLATCEANLRAAASRPSGPGAPALKVKVEAEAVECSNKSVQELEEPVRFKGVDVQGQQQPDLTDLVQAATAPAAEEESHQAEGGRPPGAGASAPQAGPEVEATDGSSKSVRELKAFLRSRGVDLDLVDAVRAVSAQPQQGGRQV